MESFIKPQAPNDFSDGKMAMLKVRHQDGNGAEQRRIYDKQQENKNKNK